MTFLLGHIVLPSIAAVVIVLVAVGAYSAPVRRKSLMQAAYDAWWDGIERGRG